MKTSLDERTEPRPTVARQRRVVLVGASNLTKGIGTVLSTALDIWSGPLEVLAAFGHGRSYGRPSRVLGRELPGLGQCGLWADLAAGSQVPTAALVTDIGNDLLYEEPVERIAGWLEACLDRLAAARADTVVTLLPIDNLSGISAARFYFFRTLFVPRCRIALDEIVRRAIELDERVRQLAIARGFTTIRPRRQWYGLDPIHIRLTRRGRAWREILGGWNDPGHSGRRGGNGRVQAAAKSPFGRTLYLRTRTPERRRVWGFEQRGRQPAATLGDGTTVAIY